MNRYIRRCAPLMILAISTATADEGFRELTVRLDHEVHARPLSIRLDDNAGLIAVGQLGDVWRYSVVSLADGAVVGAGEIPESVIFYDSGDLQGRGADQLCFLTEDGVSVLDPVSGTTAEVADISTIYHGNPFRGPALSDFVRDVDGDDSDDILAPLFSGWLLLRQRATGFERYALEMPPRVRVYPTRVTYQPRQPRVGDVDGDGRNDVVFLRGREFISFPQEASGGFSAEGQRVFVDAPLATEQQRARWERDDGQVDQSDLEIEDVEIVRDFNGDDILDLLTEKSISEGVLDRRSEYHLYLGRREGDTLSYPRQPDGSIASDGIQFDPIVVDVDGDGRLDIATPSTRLGLARIVGALFSGRMGVDLDVYRMRADGTFPADSDYRTRFKVEFDLKTGLSRYPAVMVADLDGDGRAELLVQEDADQLTLLPGVDDSTIFGKSERVVSLPLPRNGLMVEARDLDDDDRADILVRYGPADGEDLARELRVLLSD